MKGALLEAQHNVNNDLTFRNSRATPVLCGTQLKDLKGEKDTITLRWGEQMRQSRYPIIDGGLRSRQRAISDAYRQKGLLITINRVTSINKRGIVGGRFGDHVCVGYAPLYNVGECNQCKTQKIHQTSSHNHEVS